MPGFFSKADRYDVGSLLEGLEALFKPVQTAANIKPGGPNKQAAALLQVCIANITATAEGKAKINPQETQNIGNDGENDGLKPTF